MTIRKKIKCIDLFSGCGGMSLGFENAGMKVLAAFENWQPAVDVYKLNFNHRIYNENLNDIEKCAAIIKKHSPDLIMGGPPCQDFSSAGKRDIKGGRADLTYKFSDLVTLVQPKWFVMENVELIKKTQIIRDITENFISSGYGLTSTILDASYCGVPQKRKRFFLIGCKGVNHNILHNNIVHNLNSKPLTVKDYLGESLKIAHYYRHPRNYNRRAVYSTNEPSATIRGVNRPVPSGYKLNSCDSPNVDLKKIRPLTTLERSYIQTFPNDFIFSGTKTNLEQMIGNAVPVKLAQFIASSILDYIKDGNRMNGELFTYDSTFILAQTTSKKHE